jgi:hypothetical protein
LFPLNIPAFQSTRKPIALFCLVVIKDMMFNKPTHGADKQPLKSHLYQTLATHSPHLASSLFFSVRPTPVIPVFHRDATPSPLGLLRHHPKQ